MIATARAAFLLSLVAATASAQILETEVWTGALSVRDGQLQISDLTNISKEHPGYDNQPAFFPDGKTLVYSSRATDVDDTGLGVNAVLVDLTTGTARTLPDARGFSPTPTADGRQLMVLRQGGVWLHDLDGKEIRALTDTTEAGYFTPFDDRQWALFMNDKERRIVIYDPKTKTLETMATGATTAPYRIPGQRAVSFAATNVLHRLDLKTRKVETLATIPFPTGGHHVWTSRGTLLIASGQTIYEWSPSSPEVWSPVYRAGHPDLQGITRIALSPRGDRIALVSTPRDETVIRNSRAESNRMIAAHRADFAARLFRTDATVTTAMGKVRTGREAIEKSLAEQFTTRPDVVYVRTPESIEISRSDNAASERGTWTGRWTAPSGPVDLRGNYSAVWRRDLSATGARTWTIQTELFVPLDCTGGGCGER